jgi:HSP20 family molecular chaperone IbpA
MKITPTKLAILTGAAATLLTASPAFAAAPAQTNPTTTPQESQATPPATTQGERWSDRVFDEFQQMQSRMEKLFDDASRQFDQNAGISESNGFTSSVKLSEDHGDYIVHLSLPDRDMKNVDAKVEADNVLRITAKEEKKETPANAAKGNEKAPPVTYELGRYEQLLTLPGPVDASKIKIDRAGDWVTITLPKAGQPGSVGGK